MKFQRLLVAFSCAALVSCGGSGSGDSSSAPPNINTSSDAALQVKADYQPGVRSMGSDAGGPQLQQVDGAQLHFDRATDAKPGEVLIVDGRAYVVVDVAQGGAIINTRTPGLGEVFQALTIRGSIDTDTTKRQPVQAGSIAKLDIGQTEQRLSYAYDFFLAPQIKTSLGVSVGLTGSIDFDFDANSGIRRFDLTAAGNFGETINITFDTLNGAGKSPDGIEIARWVLPIAQTGGLAAIEIPLMATAQYTGDARATLQLQSGSSAFSVAAHLNAETGQLETSGSFAANSSGGAPTLVDAVPQSTTAKLGMAFKVGPDVQFTLLKGSLAPVTVGVRGGTELTGQAKNNGTQTCIGWAVAAKGEMSAKLKLTDALKLSQTYTTAPSTFASGGNLDECNPQEPVTPGDPADPSAPEPTAALSTAKGQLLLPSPDLPLLTDYELRIVGNRAAGDDGDCTHWTTPSPYSYDLCRTVLEFAIFRTGESAPAGPYTDPSFPFTIDWSSLLCRMQAPKYFYEMDVPAADGKTGEFTITSAVIDSFSASRFGWALDMVRVHGTSPTAVYPFRLVCQLQLTSKASPLQRYYVRHERYFNDFAGLVGATPVMTYVTWK